jgi:hypothetical protein
MTLWRNIPGSVAIVFLFTASLSARTITLTGEDGDRMAVISAAAPRLSWAMLQTNGVYNTQPLILWNSKMALLLRFPIAEKIPRGQRITHAELTMAATYLSGNPEIHVRRILAEWGPGVCHQYRMTYPDKVEWTQPGGRGGATDRSARDSAVFKFAKVGTQTVELTEDVELWYTNAAPNRGWIMTMETDGHNIYVPSPYAPYVNGGRQWKLQITFEPQ